MMYKKKQYLALGLTGILIFFSGCQEVLDILLEEPVKQESHSKSSETSDEMPADIEDSGSIEDESTDSEEVFEDPFPDGSEGDMSEIPSPEMPTLDEEDSPPSSDPEPESESEPEFVFTPEAGKAIEQSFYEQLLAYRESLGLPSIAYSHGLAKVARLHSQDQAINPEIFALTIYDEPEEADGKCNFHSWTDQGEWTPCCYTPDHAQAECMWHKPKEILGVDSIGFEISSLQYFHFIDGDSKTYDEMAQDHLEAFIDSEKHHAVMINGDNWQDTEWKAVGVGVHHVWKPAQEGKSPARQESHLNVWFAREEIP